MAPRDGRPSALTRLGTRILRKIRSLFRKKPPPPPEIVLVAVVRRSPSPIATVSVNLNHDILVYIMTFLERADLVSMMQTCHDLQTGGAPYLLRYTPFLTGDVALRSFFSFMLVSQPDRFPMLHACDLGLRCSLSDRTISLMTRTLICCNDITRLYLTIFDDLLEDSPEVGMVLESLPNVRLCWIRTYARTYPIAECIGRMRSPLELVAFESRDGLAYPDMLLQKFSDTLESLIISFADLMELKARYPRMRHLEFTDQAAVKLQNSTLLSSFPSLSIWDFPFQPPKYDDVIEDQRSANRQTFMINGCWSRLERVSGHIRHIYRTGLSCKVDHLDCAMYANDVQKFRTVLHDALPWRLDLSIHLDLFPMDLSLGIFKDTLGITELRLFISFDEFYGLNDPLVDAEVAQDNLREVVAPLQLTALEVELDWKGATSNHDPEHRSLTALNSFRFRDFARQIMAVQSSLHSFALSITGTAAAKWEIDRSSPNYPLLVMCDMQHSEQVLIA